MRKAKDFANDILSATTDQLDVVIVEVASDMMGEIQELAKVRNISSNKGLKNIILQQNQKWKAICRKVNADRTILDENGFMAYLNHKMPMTKSIMNS